MWHDFLPLHEITSPIGKLAVQFPRGQPWGVSHGPKGCFISSLVPPYLHQSNPVEEVLLWLYLNVILTGNFSQALASLLLTDTDTFCRHNSAYTGDLVGQM
jgi:hypothetical protein